MAAKRKQKRWTDAKIAEWLGKAAADFFMLAIQMEKAEQARLRAEKAKQALKKAKKGRKNGR